MFKIINYLFLILMLISCSNYKATDPIYDFSNNKSVIPENVNTDYILKADASESEIESKMKSYFDKYGYYILFLEDTADNINKNNTLSIINNITKKDSYMKDGIYIDLSRTSIDSIPDNAFSDNINLIEIKLPNTVQSIGNEAFQNCKMLSSINFPSSIKEIGNSVFQFCIKLETIDLSKTKITIINGKTFYNCLSLSVVKLNEEIKTIAVEAFAYCYSLYQINLPSALIQILPSAFVNCRSLTKISLPKSLQIIYRFSFGDCKSLKNIEYLGNNANDITVKNGNVFEGYEEDSKPENLYLPNASSDTSWETFLGYNWNKDKIFYGQNMPN